jgi:hypothetical protein
VNHPTRQINSDQGVIGDNGESGPPLKVVGAPPFIDTPPPDNASALATAQWALSVGLWPVVITSIDAKVESPGKAPIGNAWGATRPTKGTLAQTFRRHPGANVGLKLGIEGRVIDIEVDDADQARDVLTRMFPDGIPPTLGWNSSKGPHLLFQYDERLAKYGASIIKASVNKHGEATKHARYLGIEIRIGGRPGQAKQIQSVIPPSLATDGTPRAWNGNADILPLPESFFADLDRYAIAPPPAPAATPQTAQRRPTNRTDGPSAEERASRWLAKCEPAISGQRGHDKLLWAASVGPKFDLSEGATLQLLKADYNPRCEPPWSDRELEHKIAEAYRLNPNRGELLNAPKDDRKPPRPAKEARNGGADSPVRVPVEVFSNFVLVAGTSPQGKDTLVKEPIRMAEITASLEGITPGWPKRVGESLFLEGPGYEPVYLGNTARLFASIDRHAVTDWGKGNRFVTQERFFEHLRMTAEKYEAIETVPHWPPLPSSYYMHAPIPRRAGLLDRVLDAFNPASDVDRELIRSMIFTLFWGGAPGSRPAFLVTSADDDPNQGRGAGKSALTSVISEELANGNIEVSPTDSIAEVKTRLLSAEARQKRVARIDNIKTLRFSWADLEGLITSPVISGRELYQGEGRRPNTIVWVLTLNGASLSKDMAERVVVIKVRRPNYAPDWEENLRALIRANRLGILADIRDALMDDPGMVTPKTRWSSWEKGVLSKTDNFPGCQTAILERQKVIDTDNEERDLVADFFREQIELCGRNAETDVLFITTAVAAEWLIRATSKRLPTNQASNCLAGLGIPELRRSKTNGIRGWYWTGPESCHGASAEHLHVPRTAMAGASPNGRPDLF